MHAFTASSSFAVRKANSHHTSSATARAVCSRATARSVATPLDDHLLGKLTNPIKKPSFPNV
jgi:hypothetical protein